MSIEIPDVVIDTNGTKYKLDRLLGRGGQGTVFAVHGRDLAVKLSGVHQQFAQQRVRENIARIRRLPLDGLNIARPLMALREPHIGYIMELMTGMVPLQTLLQVPREQASNLTQWYLETGSLYRRLRVLAKTATLFRALHERGCAYGDASPNNIFISGSSSAFEVWLIDCDNIVQGVYPRAVYTPGYAAPELLKGHCGADSLTDAWALGIIVFETLCILHPFYGDLVHDGDPELEEKAFRGEIPWVDDASDSSNHGSLGLPRQMVLTSSLQRLAADCFGASRLDRESRPTVAAWAEKLLQAADQVLICPDCKSSYYINSASCPWCDAARPPFVTIDLYLRDQSLENDKRTPFKLICKIPGRPSLIERIVIQLGREATLTNRHLRGNQDETSQVVASLEGKHLLLQGTENCTYAIEQPREGKYLPLAGRTERIDLRQGMTLWSLVPLKADDLHRVAFFKLYEANGS